MPMCFVVSLCFSKDYPALFSTLEETQINNVGAKDAKSRQTASDAAQLKNKLANKKFVNPIRCV